MPAASAGPSFQQAISSGKFHGTMAATTPTGSRVTRPSSSGPVGATCRCRALSTASAHQRRQRAAEGMSIFRASRTGLPMSRLSSSASSSRCVSSSSAKRCSTALRRTGASRDQTPDSKVARASRTAASASASPQLATRRQPAAVDRAQAVEGRAVRRRHIGAMDEGAAFDGRYSARAVPSRRGSACSWAILPLSVMAHHGGAEGRARTATPRAGLRTDRGEAPDARPRRRRLRGGGSGRSSAGGLAESLTDRR